MPRVFAFMGGASAQRSGRENRRAEAVQLGDRYLTETIVVRRSNHAAEATGSGRFLRVSSQERAESHLREGTNPCLQDLPSHSESV